MSARAMPPSTCALDYMRWYTFRTHRRTQNLEILLDSVQFLAHGQQHPSVFMDMLRPNFDGNVLPDLTAAHKFLEMHRIWKLFYFFIM